jgi:hypothetical protein
MISSCFLTEEAPTPKWGPMNNGFHGLRPFPGPHMVLDDLGSYSKPN